MFSESSEGSEGYSGRKDAFSGIHFIKVFRQSFVNHLKTFLKSEFILH